MSRPAQLVTVFALLVLALLVLALLVLALLVLALLVLVQPEKESVDVASQLCSGLLLLLGPLLLSLKCGRDC